MPSPALALASAAVTWSCIALGKVSIAVVKASALVAGASAYAWGLDGTAVCPLTCSRRAMMTSGAIFWVISFSASAASASAALALCNAASNGFKCAVLCREVFSSSSGLSTTAGCSI